MSSSRINSLSRAMNLESQYKRWQILQAVLSIQSTGFYNFIASTKYSFSHSDTVSTVNHNMSQCVQAQIILFI